MADLKTQPSDLSVDDFLARVQPAHRRQDALRVAALMGEITGEEPRLWGSSIVGFGRYHYRYPSGREGDWFLTGFSPRKASLSLYVMAGFEDFPDLMARLGKHRTGKSCLYVKRLEDIDLEVLEELIRRSVEAVRLRYGS